MKIRTGVDAEFTDVRIHDRLQHDDRFHPHCVSNIRKMRASFLLVSLLYRLNGVDGKANSGFAGFGWAEIPRALGYVCSEYPPTTAREVITVDPPICGECFKRWVFNIQNGWQDCVNTIFASLSHPPCDLARLQHAVDCLLKSDP